MRKLFILALIVVSASLFGYGAITLELQRSINCNEYAGCIAFDFGATYSDSSVSEAIFAIGYQHGRLLQHPYGKLYCSQGGKEHRFDGWGLRAENRKGVAYIADCEKLAASIEVQLGVYWRWLQCSFGYETAIWIRNRSLYSQGAFRVSIAIRNAIFY